MNAMDREEERNRALRLKPRDRISCRLAKTVDTLGNSGNST